VQRGRVEDKSKEMPSKKRGGWTWCLGKLYDEKEKWDRTDMKNKYCGANDIAANREAYAYTDVDWLTEWR